MRRCEKESCCGIDIDIFLKKIKPLLKYNDQQINALPIKRDNDLDLKIIEVDDLFLDGAPNP